jgi:hypothetical protein
MVFIHLPQASLIPARHGGTEPHHTILARECWKSIDGDGAIAIDAEEAIITAVRVKAGQ